MEKHHLIKSFHLLSFDQKKEKVIQLLNGLKESDVMFMNALKYIRTVEVDEAYIDSIYINIIEFGSAIKLQKNNKNRELTQEKIKSIKEKEASEKSKDDLDFLIF